MDVFSIAKGVLMAKQDSILGSSGMTVSRYRTIYVLGVFSFPLPHMSTKRLWISVQVITY